MFYLCALLTCSIMTSASNKTANHFSRNECRKISNNVGKTLESELRLAAKCENERSYYFENVDEFEYTTEMAKFALQYLQGQQNSSLHIPVMAKHRKRKSFMYLFPKLASRFVAKLKRFFDLDMGPFGCAVCTSASGTNASCLFTTSLPRGNSIYQSGWSKIRRCKD